MDGRERLSDALCVAGTQSLLRRLAFALSRGENWRMRNHDVPGFIRKFLLFVLRRAGDARRAFLCATLLAASPAATLAQSPQGGATFPVGIRELEYIDPHEGGRHLALSVRSEEHTSE